MRAPSSRMIHVSAAALMILILIGVIAWPLVGIQLRLRRNGAIGARLVESLRTRFPEADFRGVASYEREVIYISVVGGLSRESRPEVEQWLRSLKVEQKITPEIFLRFPDTPDEDKDAIRI